MTVELRLLRALVILGEEGHVGRAATRLNLTQPGLSKQIAGLERDTGLQLFLRQPAGVTPTAAGTLLIERARRVLEEAAGFSLAAEQAQRSIQGHLKLGFVGSALNEHTAQLLRAFRQRHPDVTVDMRQYDMDDLTGGLDCGASDLAFLRLPVGGAHLIHEPFLVEPRVAVLPDDHALATSASIGVGELFGEAWVVSASSDPEYQNFALAMDARRGSTPILGPVIHNIDEYLEAVLAHLGIGLAPASARRYYSRPGVTFVTVRDAEPSVASVSYVRGRPLGKAAEGMLHLARERLPVGSDS